MLQTAFAGSGYLFKMLDKNCYEAEMKRHNKALEELAASKEKFCKNEVKHYQMLMKTVRGQTKHFTISDRSKHSTENSN